MEIYENPNENTGQSFRIHRKSESHARITSHVLPNATCDSNQACFIWIDPTSESSLPFTRIPHANPMRETNPT